MVSGHRSLGPWGFHRALDPQPAIGHVLHPEQLPWETIVHIMILRAQAQNAHLLFLGLDKEEFEAMFASLMPPHATTNLCSELAAFSQLPGQA